MRHRQDQGTRPPLDGLEPDGESLAPDGRQEGRSASRAVGKPRSAEGRRVQAGRDLVRANRSAHPDQHQSWLDGIVRTPRLRVETQPPARPLRQHPAMPVRAPNPWRASAAGAGASSDPRNGARPAAAARARPRYRRDARDPPAARARGRASYRTRRTRKHWRPSPLPGTPARRGPRAPRPLPCRRSGHATNAAAHPAPARTPDRSCSAPADRPRAAAAPPCPPARDRPPPRGSRRRRPAPPRLQAAASDRPARPARCARVGHAAGFDHDPFRQRIQRQHPRQRLVEAAGQRAADAAIGQPQHLPGAVRQQARVHVHRPEVVHQHRRAPPVLRQRMVQQRGLARARKPPTTVSGMRPPFAPSISGVRGHRPSADDGARHPRVLQALGRQSRGSSSSTQKSACLPTSMEPTR